MTLRANRRAAIPNDRQKVGALTVTWLDRECGFESHRRVLETRKQTIMKAEVQKMKELRYWIVDRAPEFEDAIERFRLRHEEVSEVVEALGRVQRGELADKEVLTSIALVLWMVDRDECIRRFGDNMFTQCFLASAVDYKRKSMCSQLGDLRRDLKDESWLPAVLGMKS